MRLTRRQIEALLAFPEAELKDESWNRQLIGRYHGHTILIADQAGAYWDVSFEGPRWTIPAFIAPGD